MTDESKMKSDPNRPQDTRTQGRETSKSGSAGTSPGSGPPSGDPVRREFGDKTDST